MDLAWLLLLLPLTAATAILLRLHRQPDMAMFAAIGSSALSLIITFDRLDDAPALPTLPWLTIGGWHLDFCLLLDPLAKTFLLALNYLLFFIQLYAIGALAGDPRRAPIFGVFSFLSFALTGLVLSANLFMLLVFSELAAWAIFLLLRFGPEESADAGERLLPAQWFWNIGLIIGLLSLALLTGGISVQPETLGPLLQPIDTTRITILPSELPPDLKAHLALHSAGTAAAAIPLLGVMGLGFFGSLLVRLALPPFSGWLPRGASGSAPGLALLGLFSLTGVFVLVRLYPFLVLSYFTLDLLALLGAVSALLGGFKAWQQTDLKKMLAWLYVSQLGLMTMTVGCGLPSAALLQAILGGSALTLLILAAGSFQQNRPTSAAELSGRGWTQPWTGGAFAAGALSLVGVPPLSGFFLNEELLCSSGQTHLAFYLVNLLVLLITTFCLSRVLALLFRDRVPPAGRESAPILTLPLLFLAPLVVLGGIPLGPYGLKNFLHNTMVFILQSSGELPRDGRFVPLPHLPFFFSMIAPLLVIGFAGQWALARHQRGATWWKNLPAFAAPQKTISFSLALARTLAWVENWVVEGILWRGTAWCSVILGELFRLLQTGDRRSYAWLFLVGGLA